MAQIKEVWHFLGGYGIFFWENLEGLSAKTTFVAGAQKRLWWSAYASQIKNQLNYAMCGIKKENMKAKVDISYRYNKNWPLVARVVTFRPIMASLATYVSQI